MDIYSVRLDGSTLPQIPQHIPFDAPPKIIPILSAG